MRVPWLYLLGCLAAAQAVWPPPQSMEARGARLHLGRGFRVQTTSSSPKLASAIKRFTPFLEGRPTPSLGGLPHLHIQIDSENEHLGLTTDYSYQLDITSTGATAKATTVYGGMYALETFQQLLGQYKVLMHDTIHIQDSPKYAWRGLMIDSGRRFFPVPIVQNLMDTMAAVKMNVLHLHASDLCRFGVESKLYPNLTQSLTGIHGGYFTQADIAGLIKYGGDRGIRVVPEFDIPGHSRGFVPIKSKGIEFCTSGTSQDQLYGDPKDSTLNVLKPLLKEMSGLFTDEVFNIGCDETRVTGPCTLKSTFALERTVLNAIQHEFNKTPEGWEEVLFDAGAATNETIVNAWARHTAAQITATGRRAVESSDSHFYFTSPGPAGPAGWSKCWYDISTNVAPKDEKLLLGGEISMWTDRYCYARECTPGAPPEDGAPLFPPSRDKEFGESVGGMIWPRGYVAAAAFWNYNHTANPASTEFTNAIYALNDQLASRGALVCPSKCACNLLTACGKPYIKPTPPVIGSIVSLKTCADPSNLVGQEWVLQSNGMLALKANTSLCLVYPGKETYPLHLGDCAKGVVLHHDAATSEIQFKATGDCLDEKGDGSVGAWECGGGGNQPNQHWAIDSVTGNVVSTSRYPDGTRSARAGDCLTASA